MADNQPILDLQTLIERPFIRVDGESYELYSPGELSLIQSQQFMRWGKRIEELASSDKATDDVELTDTVARVAQAALVDMPDTVFVSLSDQHKLQIVEVFTTLLQGPKRLLAAAIVKQALGGKAKPETGAPSSQGSAASMAETPATGSNERRSQ